jgi:hypothetical protein
MERLCRSRGAGQGPYGSTIGSGFDVVFSEMFGDDC